MQISRQTTEAGDDPRVTGIASMHGTGSLASHMHAGKAQLMFAVRGMMNVTTQSGRWILPAGRALWIPAGIEHGLEVHRPVQLEILYIDAAAERLPPWPGCVVVNVSPLLRGLIGACVIQQQDYAVDSPQARLADVLIDQLAAMPHAPVHLPEPRDPRAVRIADLARADPSSRMKLVELAPLAASSVRTIERLFTAETGMSFGAWRHRLRMILALERLAEGENVVNTADAAGYDNPSSFIAAFRAMFGRTPGQYFDD